jgi:LacI family transcriptional regulator
MPTLTLEDIAKKAGVSRSTVSRVINNQPSVRDEVRQRVLSIIQETGYQPHLAARSLASQRSGIIGLVIPRSVHTLFTDPYFPRLTQGIAQACNRADYTLALFLVHDKEEEEKLYPRITRQGLLDGVILQVGLMGDRLISEVAQSEMPFIVAGRPVNAESASFVDVDNVSGAYNAVSHLIGLGYRRIGTVTGAMNTTTGVDRLQGYRQALERRGIPIVEKLIVEGDYSESSAYYATRRILPQNPDALFVASDAMALGALRAIRDLGLDVPQDIALVSFDDLPPATSAEPPLTTVRQPIRRLGIKLVETLLDIIDEGCKLPQRIIFDTELIIRESCGSNQPELHRA